MPIDALNNDYDADIMGSFSPQSSLRTCVIARVLADDR
jgi:hypothetical protein